MSRHLRTENGKLVEMIADPDKCVWLCDEVCCNDRSEWLADFPHDNCNSCKLFTEERYDENR